MNLMWPNDLLFRRFTPLEVERHTGVSPERQRLLASRHHDFRLEPPEQEGLRKRWYWAGLQALVIFTDILSDLKDATIATTAVADPDLISALEFDFRAPEGGDLLLTIPFDGAPWGGTTNVDGLARLFAFVNTSARPTRAYIYNISDMQRRMADRVGLIESA